MRIAFNGLGCGWGNNGGTQSIFRMAGALSKLGHEVKVWSHCDNKFTWFPLADGVEHLKTNIKDAPEVDVLIASGCTTVRKTYDFPRKKVGRPLPICETGFPKLPSEGRRSISALSSPTSP